MDNEQYIQSFWEHVEEFRKVLLLAVLVVLAGFAISFWFYQPIIGFLTKTIPAREVVGENRLVRHELCRERFFNQSDGEEIVSLEGRKAEVIRFSHGVSQLGQLRYKIPAGGYLDVEFPGSHCPLVLFSPIEGMIIAMKVSLWVSLLGTSPIWLAFFLWFAYPALRSSERRLILPFFIFSCLFLWLGLVFAYGVTLPLANTYFLSFNEEIGRNLWSLREYFDYALWVMLSTGFAFEIGFVLLFLVYMGLITADTMASWRRTMIVVSFILGALLTPPDVLSQVMLAVPLILLYETAYLYAKIREHFSCTLFGMKKNSFIRKTL
jgi:sec-independent protein translocase protein TatC